MSTKCGIVEKKVKEILTVKNNLKCSGSFQTWWKTLPYKSKKYDNLYKDKYKENHGYACKYKIVNIKLLN